MHDPYSRFDQREQQREREADLDAIEARGQWYRDLWSWMRVDGEPPFTPGADAALVQAARDFLKVAA